MEGGWGGSGNGHGDGEADGEEDRGLKLHGDFCCWTGSEDGGVIWRY